MLKFPEELARANLGVIIEQEDVNSYNFEEDSEEEVSSLDDKDEKYFKKKFRDEKSLFFQNYQK